MHLVPRGEHREVKETAGHGARFCPLFAPFFFSAPHVINPLANPVYHRAQDEPCGWRGKTTTSVGWKRT